MRDVFEEGRNGWVEYAREDSEEELRLQQERGVFLFLCEISKSNSPYSQIAELEVWPAIRKKGFRGKNTPSISRVF